MSVCISKSLLAACGREESCVPRLGSPSLFVLTSLAVPESSWRQMSSQLEKVGGVFLLRGMPEDSFLAFAKAMFHFKSIGINAPIFIDPERFAMLQAKTVPMILLEGEKGIDIISGNISLFFALKEFEAKGKNKELAKKLLFDLKSSHVSSISEEPSVFSNISPFKRKEVKP